MNAFYFVSNIFLSLIDFKDKFLKFHALIGFDITRFLLIHPFSLNFLSNTLTIKEYS